VIEQESAPGDATFTDYIQLYVAVSYADGAAKWMPRLKWLASKKAIVIYDS